MNKTILEEAKDLLYNDRQEDYGDTNVNFGRVAKFWSAALGTEVNSEQVALCMVLMKVSRQIQNPKRDNLIDGCGYFAAIEKMQTELNENKPIETQSNKCKF
jgi:hypothetical protein